MAAISTIIAAAYLDTDQVPSILRCVSTVRSTHSQV